jgi:PAS domain S-box-containing protein
MAKTEPNGEERKLADDAFVVSITDTSGRITYVNRTFLEISGYSEQELLGRPHNLVRDPEMPAAIYHLLWEALKASREFVLFIRSLGKDGSHHWGFSTIVPSHDGQGRVIGYYSVRRKALPSAVAAVSGLYRAMREEEARSPGKRGVQASLAVLNNVLSEKGMGYEQYVLHLQSA